MFKFPLICAAAGLVLAGCATTSNTMRPATPEDPFAMPVDEFLYEKQVLLANLEKGEPRELDEFEWRRLNRITGNITELVGDARKLDDIDLETRNTLFKLRNQLVAMLIDGSAEEIVCHNVRLTGTRIGSNQRVCMSRNEMEKSRFRAQFALEFLNATPEGIGLGGSPGGIEPVIEGPRN